MKEINVTNIPNARNIIIPKRIKKIPLNEYIYTAYQHLSTLGARAIYIYLLTYPESNVKIGFDSLVNKKMNISNGTRLNGFTTLVEKGYLDDVTLIERMAINPGKLIGVRCALDIGKPANMVVVDPKATWIYKESVSKSNNSPFLNRKMIGKVIMTFAKGKCVYKATDK